MSIAAAIEMSEPILASYAYEPEIRYIVEGVEVSVGFVHECMRLSNEIRERSSMSIEQYSEVKTWMYESMASIGIDFSTAVATESHPNLKSLALEGLGSFFIKIWEAIKSGFRFILNIFKRMFGFDVESRRKQDEHKLKSMEDKAKQIVSKKEVYDPVQVKKIFEGMPTLNAYKEGIFAHLKDSNIGSIREFLRSQEVKYSRMMDLIKELVGPASPARVFRQRLVEGGQFETLSDKMATIPMEDIDNFKTLIAGLTTHQANCFNHMPTIDDQAKLKSIFTSKHSDAAQGYALSRASYMVYFAMNKYHLFVLANKASKDTETPAMKSIKDNMVSLGVFDITEHWPTRKSAKVYLLEPEDIGPLLLNIGYVKTKMASALTNIQGLVDDMQVAEGVTNVMVNSMTGTQQNNELFKKNSEVVAFVLREYLSTLSIVRSLMEASASIDRYQKYAGDCMDCYMSSVDTYANKKE